MLFRIILKIIMYPFFLFTKTENRMYENLLIISIINKHSFCNLQNFQRH